MRRSLIKFGAILLVLSVFSGSLLLTTDSSALSVVRLNFEDLSRQADFVFHGRFTGSTVKESRDGRWLYTVYNFSVSRCYRMTTDHCPTSTGVVLLGGELGDRILEVPGVPDFNQLSPEVILFLSNGTPTGVGQGIFEIRDGKVESPLLQSIGHNKMDLALFESEMRKALTSTLRGPCESLLCPVQAPPSTPPTSPSTCAPFPKNSSGPGTNSVKTSIDVSKFTQSMFVFCAAQPMSGFTAGTSMPAPMILQGAFVNAGQWMPFVCRLDGLEQGKGYQIYAGAYLNAPQCMTRPDLSGFYDSDGDGKPNTITIYGSGIVLDDTKPMIVLKPMK